MVLGFLGTTVKTETRVSEKAAPSATNTPHQDERRQDRKRESTTSNRGIIFALFCTKRYCVLRRARWEIHEW